MMKSLGKEAVESPKKWAPIFLSYPATMFLPLKTALLKFWHIWVVFVVGRRVAYRRSVGLFGVIIVRAELFKPLRLRGQLLCLGHSTFTVRVKYEF